MKTTTILAALALAITLQACGEEPFFVIEEPAALHVKEQLQGGSAGNEEIGVGCPECRPAPPGAPIPVEQKEELQDQKNDEEGDYSGGGRPAPPDWPLAAPEKEQLQGIEPDEEGEG